MRITIKYVIFKYLPKAGIVIENYYQVRHIKILTTILALFFPFSRLENTQYAASNGVKEEGSSCLDVPASSAGNWPDNRKGLKEEKISD